MVCLPVQGNNPRALANGLPLVKVDKQWYNFYTTLISVDLAQYRILCANVYSFCQG